MAEICQVPALHFSSRGRYRPEAIVIHIAEGGFEAIGQWFRNPVSGVSAHYGVSQDGRIAQYVAEEQAAWHAGEVERPTWPLLKSGVNPNLYTIGIEHAGKGDTPWSDVMYEASASLAADICRRWGIPADRLHFPGHREIKASKGCPGSKVDLDRYVAMVQAKLAKGANQPLLRYAKIAWAMEQAARILEAEGYDAEAKVLLASDVYRDGVAKR